MCDRRASIIFVTSTFPDQKVSKNAFDVTPPFFPLLLPPFSSSPLFPNGRRSLYITREDLLSLLPPFSVASRFEEVGTESNIFRLRPVSVSSPFFFSFFFFSKLGLLMKWGNRRASIRAIFLHFPSFFFPFSFRWRFDGWDNALALWQGAGPPFSFPSEREIMAFS